MTDLAKELREHADATGYDDVAELMRRAADRLDLATKLRTLLDGLEHEAEDLAESDSVAAACHVIERVRALLDE